jgi:DNA-binding XRE family transcriptional regulator/uncharacterized protein YxeA
MTYVEYAETTSPGFLEFLAFICLSIAYIFVTISRLADSDKYIYLFLGIFEAAILLVLTINFVTFQMVHHDIRIIPGPTFFILILNAAAGIYFGWPQKSTDEPEEEPEESKVGYVDPSKIRPIADILRENREAAGVTQQGLADKILVSRQTVHRWESGKSHPDMELMIRVAQALNFPVTEFWGGDSEKMNDEIGNVAKRGKIYRQAAYFLLSLIIVVVAVFSVAYLGRNFHSQYLDRVNPFMKEQTGYVLVERSGKQKAAVIDDEFGDGNIVTINGSYNNKDEFVKVVHRGAYVKYEHRNIPKKDVPADVRDNLYQISHFDDPTQGLQNLQKSYTKRYI